MLEQRPILLQKTYFRAENTQPKTVVLTFCYAGPFGKRCKIGRQWCNSRHAHASCDVAGQLIVVCFPSGKASLHINSLIKEKQRNMSFNATVALWMQIERP